MTRLPLLHLLGRLRAVSLASLPAPRALSSRQQQQHMLSLWSCMRPVSTTVRLCSRIAPADLPLLSLGSRRSCNPVQLPSVRHLTMSGACSEEGEGSKDAAKTPIASVEPQYAAVYTCNVCDVRSSQRFSKKAYHEGIVIVTCPGCKSKHLLADNIGWFDHFEGKNVEEFLAEKGQQVTKLTANGSVPGQAWDILPSDLELLMQPSSSSPSLPQTSGDAAQDDSVDEAATEGRDGEESKK